MEHKTADERLLGEDSLSTVVGVIFIVGSLFPVFFLASPPVAERPPAPAVERAVEVPDVPCRMGVDAPMPFLRCGIPARQFERLRQEVTAGTGFDFLARCGDMMRGKGDRSSKPGVAENSKHKSGQAFDYNQDERRVLLVREDVGGRTFWRTYLLCERQDGTCGAKADLETANAGSVSGYVFDFTAAAEAHGWQRVPAQEGWERVSTKKEFWHYEMREDFVDSEAFGDPRPEPQPPGRLAPLAAPFRHLIELIRRGTRTG